VVFVFVCVVLVDLGMVRFFDRVYRRNRYSESVPSAACIARSVHRYSSESVSQLRTHHLLILALALVFIHAHLLGRRRVLHGLALALVGGRSVGGVGGRVIAEGGGLVVVAHGADGIVFVCEGSGETGRDRGDGWEKREREREKSK
jgi:hypothetical protein